MPAKKDLWAQFIKMSATCSAANTLTFSQVSIGGAFFEYAGFVLHRAEYTFNAGPLDQMTATQDNVQAAITGSDNIASLDLSYSELYDLVILNKIDAGAAANNTTFVFQKPIVHDFTGFPGGGMLVPAQDIFLGVDSSGLAGAAGVTARLWYTIKQLNAQDYFELVQRLRVLTT